MRGFPSRALFAATLWLGPDVHAALPEMRPMTGGRRQHQSCSRVERCPAWTLLLEFMIGPHVSAGADACEGHVEPEANADRVKDVEQQASYGSE